jgi:hypothetical protein
VGEGEEVGLSSTIIERSIGSIAAAAPPRPALLLAAL